MKNKFENHTIEFKDNPFWVFCVTGEIYPDGFEADSITKTSTINDDETEHPVTDDERIRVIEHMTDKYGYSQDQLDFENKCDAAEFALEASQGK